MTNVVTPVGIPSLTAPSTTAQFGLGTTVTVDNGVVVYVKAGDALAVGSVVGIDTSNVAYLLTKTIADKGHRIGVAQVAFEDDAYGFVYISGNNLSVKAKNACAPFVKLYTSGSAGMLDDSSTSQTEVLGVRLVDTATASGAAEEAVVSFPVVG